MNERAERVLKKCLERVLKGIAEGGCGVWGESAERECLKKVQRESAGRML